MLRSQFDQQLLELHNQFYEMGKDVSKAIHKSVTAFIDHDRKKAQEVIDDDVNINEQEIKLEKKSFEMIALQQPVSTDLRNIITVMKASSDLERMGDHAVAIAKSTIRVKGETRILEIEDEIKEMSRLVEEMVDQVLTAYLQHDQKKAREIAEGDVGVNKAFDRIHRHTIRAMKADTETIVAGNDYLQVAGYLERIGDYVTNVSEWIVYLQTGKISELSPSNDTEA